MKFVIQSSLVKVIILLFVSSFAFSSNSLEMKKNYTFIENKGQYPSNVNYVGHGSDADIMITNDAILFDFHNRTENGLKGHVIEMKLSGSNGFSNLDLVESGSVRNYFIGNNPTNWKIGVKEFNSIGIKNVYDGIDTKIYFEDGKPRYDFIVSPNSDPNQISISLTGHDGMLINDYNEVLISTSLGDIKHSKLFTYQSSNSINNAIKSKFKIVDGNVKFELGSYDKSKTLTIDPIVVASYIGGSSIDESKGVKTLSDTSYIITGWTESADLTTTTGAYQLTYGMNRDAFIAKYKIVNGKVVLVATTYIGTSGKDEATSIDVDFAGFVYIGGNTTSSDFPNINSLKNAFKGLSDMFVTKFSSDLGTIIHSNIFGGTADDFLNSMKVDKNGAVLFGGQTSSSDYFTKSSVQPAKKLRSDGFITRLNENGKLIDFSSFLGGADDDILNAITLFPNGDIGLIGSTLSTDFTIFPNVYVAPKMFPPDPGYTQKPYDDSQNGGWDVFLVKISGDGASYDYSTYFGGSGNDYGKACIGLNDGTMLFAGESVKETQTAKFPTSDSPFQKVNKGGKDLFLGQMGAEVITNGKNKSQFLTFSTFIGGGSDDELLSMEANVLSGSIGLVGRTKSGDFPKKILQGETSKYGGGYDGFVCEMSNNGTSLVYGALIGGDQDDAINGISYDNEGDYYISGTTQSTNFSLKSSSTLSGTSDAFSAKYVYGDLSLTSPTPSGVYCSDAILNIDWASQDLSNTGYTLELGKTSSNSLTLIGSNIKVNPFSWKIPKSIVPANDYFIKVSHKSGMVAVLNGVFKVNVPPVINSFLLASSGTFVCEGQPIKMIVNATGENLKYQWKLNGQLIPNQTSSTLSIDKTTLANDGIYTAVVSGDCIPDPETNPIVVKVGPTTKFQNQLVDTEMETGKEFTLEATAPGNIISYKWQKNKNDLVGQSTNKLLFSKPSKADEGKYRCIVEGQCGIDTTNEASLTMKSIGDVYYSNEKSDKINFRYVNENSITIQLGNLIDGNVNLNLYNTNGQLVMNLINQNYYYGVISYELNTDKLSTGLYYLKLDNANESSIKSIQVIK